MTDSCRKFVLLSIATCVLVTFCQGALPDVLERCCDVGRQWFTTNRETCTVYPSAVSGVPTADRAVCGSVIDVCCIAQRNDKQCNLGKQSARIRRSCDGLSSRPGSEQARECCHCCNLGVTAHEAGLECDLMSRFSTPCAAAYRECCEHGRQPPSSRDPSSSSSGGSDRSGDQLRYPVTDPPTTTVQPVTAGSDSNQLGICAKFPGQLCAHVCINTPDSYECACHEGFTLQSDRRTCRQDTSGNRCDVSNPCQHRCVDTGVAIHCQCLDGYLLEADGRSCRDIDECALGQHTCTAQQRCVNMEGTFSCEGPSGPTTERCTVGYSWNRNTDRCEDIDECTITRENPCASEPGQYCYNTPGSYTCRTRVTADDRVTNREDDEPADDVNPDGDDDDEEDPVVDIPEAPSPTTVPTTTERSSRHHHHHNRHQHQSDRSAQGGLNCGTGFMYNRATGRCEDIDECQSLRVRWSCSQPHQQCRNLPGSYMCADMCPRGFRYDADRHYCEDINECAMSRDTCVEGQTCENTVGSYSCRRAVSCGTGYTLDQQTQMCLDDDECTLGIHNCGVAYECRNIPGSFRCAPRQCPRGYRLDQRTGSCDPVVCARGHQPDDAGNCVDINECIERPNVCRPNQECRNTQGSYTCRNLLSCGPGFELNADGSRCEDVDECARGEHDCTGVLMHCINRQGSYVCQCADGFQVNHALRTCEDIDECSFGGQVCAQNAECENTHGSYRCTCKEGFEDDADRRSCKDIDECARPGMCQHTCRNTWGSFQCSCDEGYKIAADGRTCEDIDECREASERGLHVCIGVCENTHGSFACTCPSGFQMGADGRTCQDIDECALRATSCNGADDICVNTRGGHKCLAVTCPRGFIKSPVSSRNNNVKCQRKTFLCPQGDVECLYSPLSYSTNFLTFESRVRIPADLFTMRGPLSPYRRLVFDLKLIKAEDPITGQQRVTRSHFAVNQLRDNEAVIQLLREVEGPQDIELQLDMNIYSREFRQNDEEVFFGTAVAKIFIFVTSESW